MNPKFIKSGEKKKIIKKLNEQFGIEKIPHLLIETGKEKLRGYSGILSKEQILEFCSLTKVEVIGIYLIRKEYDFRLSFDAASILKNQITKNIIEIDEKQYEKWIRGYDLEIPAQKGTLIIKFNSDFLGCGKSNGEKIINHIPKERRIKTKLPG
jgi:NOL1/NOP2/fmu family ribosome biogenesis protein